MELVRQWKEWSARDSSATIRPWLNDSSHRVRLGEARRHHGAIESVDGSALEMSVQRVPANGRWRLRQDEEEKSNSSQDIWRTPTRWKWQADTKRAERRKLAGETLRRWRGRWQLRWLRYRRCKSRDATRYRCSESKPWNTNHRHLQQNRPLVGVRRSSEIPGGKLRFHIEAC